MTPEACALRAGLSALQSAIPLIEHIFFSQLQLVDKEDSRSL